MCCACQGGNWTNSQGEEDNDEGIEDDSVQCVDTNVRTDGSIILDNAGGGCTDYNRNTHWCTFYNTDEFISEEMCCGCQGGSTGGQEEEEDSMQCVD